jgi:putative transposase
VFPGGPCSGRSHRNARLGGRASGTARGPPRPFIPGTNAIESLNYQLRKIIKNRGHFPGDDAVVKLLWLAIRDIEDKRARQRQRERDRGVPHDKRNAPSRLIEGAVTQSWNQALNALDIAYPDRLHNWIS